MSAVKQKICTAVTHNADIKLRPDMSRYNFTMAWTRLVANSVPEIISLNNLRHSLHALVSDIRNENVLRFVILASLRYYEQSLVRIPI
jgi:hypothetical protein